MIRAVGARRTKGGSGLALIALFATSCGRVAFDPLDDAGQTPDGAGECLTSRVPIMSAADDGEIWTTSFDPDGERPMPVTYPWALYMGQWLGDLVWGYFSFVWPDVSNVTSIHLELWSEAVTAQWDAGRHALRIVAELGADAPVVTSAGDQPGGVTGRATTQTSIRWPATGGLGWSLGQPTASPELEPLLVERGPIAPGDRLQLWVTGELTGENAEVGTPDFSVDPARAAVLVIESCQ
jgi:hypothetical protein